MRRIADLPLGNAGWHTDVGAGRVRATDQPIATRRPGRIAGSAGRTAPRDADMIRVAVESLVAATVRAARLVHVAARRLLADSTNAAIPGRAVMATVAAILWVRFRIDTSAVAALGIFRAAVRVAISAAARRTIRAASGAAVWGATVVLMRRQPLRAALCTPRVVATGARRGAGREGIQAPLAAGKPGRANAASLRLRLGWIKTQAR
jgi:hypothetical protein